MHLVVCIMLIFSMAASQVEGNTLIAARDRGDRDDEKDNMFQANQRRIRQEAKQQVQDDFCSEYDGNCMHYTPPVSRPYYYYYYPK